MEPHMIDIELYSYAYVIWINHVGFMIYLNISPQNGLMIWIKAICIICNLNYYLRGTE